MPPNVGRNKSSQFRHEPDVTPLPELHKALFRLLVSSLTAARLRHLAPLVTNVGRSRIVGRLTLGMESLGGDTFVRGQVRTCEPLHLSQRGRPRCR